MELLFLILFSVFGFIISYFFYGKKLGQCFFQLVDQNNELDISSQTQKDQEDFAPSHVVTVFGHQFTTMVGAGIVLGPAIAIIWGWLPAALWVFLGSILIGGVQNLGALIVSLKNKGRSVVDITEDLYGSPIRYAFFGVVSLFLLILITLLVVFIGLVFEIFPEAVLPMWAQVAAALGLGIVLKRKPSSYKIFFALSVLVSLFLVYVGAQIPIALPDFLGVPPLISWICIILISTFILGQLSVTSFSLHRDTLHFIMVSLIVLTLLVAIGYTFYHKEFELIAPPINPVILDAPPIIPFLFLTLTCGAITGFHALISSSTTSKLIKTKKDIVPVAYGTMLLEAFFSIVIMVAVLIGLTISYQSDAGIILSGISAWDHHFASWLQADGLGAKIDALVISISNILSTLGIPQNISITAVGVFILSFAWSSLIAAVRIERMILAETFHKTPSNYLKVLSQKTFTSLFIIIISGILAFAVEINTSDSTTLWPLVGLSNMLIAASSLLIITKYLHRKGSFVFLYSGIPCFFISIIALWGIVSSEIDFVTSGNIILSLINGIILVLGCIILIIGSIKFFDKRLQP